MKKSMAFAPYGPNGSAYLESRKGHRFDSGLFRKPAYA